MGFIGALTVLFVALKLLAVIDWSWWLVLAPALVSMLLLGGAVTLLAWGAAR